MSDKEPECLQYDELKVIPVVLEMEAAVDPHGAIMMEENNEDDLEIIHSNAFVEALTVNMDESEVKDDDDKLVIDEDFDSDSDLDRGEQQHFSEYVENEDMTKEQEHDLTNRFLNGELTFSEYAALMEGNVDDGTDAHFMASLPTTSAADAFEKEVKESSKLKARRRSAGDGVRKRRRILPPALQGLMGEANLRYARGERELAVKMCLEIIRQVPTAPEPFQTLAVLYEELGAPDKSLQFALIAAHLSPHDVEQWIRLAVMSEEQGDMKQAITCYSKAIAADPSNIEIHMKRGMLLEQIGDRKTALRGYQRLLSLLTPEQGSDVVEIAKMLACKFHEDKELAKAKETMEVAFQKVPHLVKSEDVNLMLELLLSQKEYSRCLEILIQHCAIQVEAETLNDGTDPPFKIQSCTLPNSLAIDLHVKLTIVFIHLKAFHLLDELLEPLEGENPEEAGDLYLDVAEALMSEERYEDALRLLNPLVDSDNYSLAAVWLRQAECLKACGQLEAAATSYEVVVQQAPQHLEARITLSGLLNDLGRGEEALAVLTQDAESEVLEPGLLYEKCMLLKGVEGRTEEFLAVGQLLLSRHFVRIRNRDELYALTRLRRLEKKKEALKEIRTSRGEPQFDTDAPDFGVGKNTPTVDEEWALFREMCEICHRIGKFGLLQRLAFSAMGSKLFYSNAEKAREMEFLCLLACFYSGDAYYGYNLARDQLTREMKFPRIWNVFNLVLQRADDVRHNRFLMRLLARHPNHPALTILHANNCLVAGTYKYALSEYAATFRSNPDPLSAFLLGVTLFQMACQKFSAKKHSLVTQGLAFMWKYQQFRGEEGYQEVHYNIGRAFHQLGLLPPAIYHYKEALNFTSPLLEKYPHLLDLKKEAAFNLYLVYMNTGAYNIARSYIDNYIVI
ncbi:general transcription factor 3C polypeptide 3-like isoform X1 [Periplaneta americana]